MACGMICLHGVSKSYGAVRAVHEAQLCLERGEFVALLGPSGCGKTTLLRLIAGFEEPDAGVIEVAGKRVADNGTWTPPERRRVSMVFQDYALFPHLTVAANVAFGLRGWQRADAERAVAAMLERVDLSRYASSYPHMLSGGERQRVALARALVTHPRCLLADEPTGNLDRRTAGQVLDLMLELNRAVGTALVIVTHDDELAARTDRTLHLVDGVLKD